MVMIVVVMVVVDTTEWVGIAVRAGSSSSSQSTSRVPRVKSWDCSSMGFPVNGQRFAYYGSGMPSIIASVEKRILMHWPVT
jgi:hypothetical protein